MTTWVESDLSISFAAEDRVLVCTFMAGRPFANVLGRG